jgi:hypothetical protein
MLITLADGKTVYEAELVYELYWNVWCRSRGFDAPIYLVDLVAGTCTCPAFKNRPGPCKHIKMLERAVERRAQP